MVSFISSNPLALVLFLFQLLPFAQNFRAVIKLAPISHLREENEKFLRAFMVNKKSRFKNSFLLFPLESKPTGFRAGAGMAQW